MRKRRDKNRRERNKKRREKRAAWVPPVRHVSVSARVPVEVWAWMRRQAEAEGRTVSDLVRTCILTKTHCHAKTSEWAARPK